jgi:hypothetical protein
MELESVYGHGARESAVGTSASHHQTSHHQTSRPLDSSAAAARGLERQCWSVRQNSSSSSAPVAPTAVQHSIRPCRVSIPLSAPQVALPQLTLSLSLSLPVRSPALDSLPRVLGLVALARNMSHNRTAQGVFVGRARGSSPPPTWGGSPGHPPSPFLALPLPSSPFLSLPLPSSPFLSLHMPA